VSALVVEPLRLDHEGAGDWGEAEDQRPDSGRLTVGQTLACAPR
jgi:hypothetical protein